MGEIISEQTLIPLGMFLAGLAMAVSGGVMYGRVQGTIKALGEADKRQEGRIDFLHKEVEAMKNLAVPLERRLTTIEVSLADLNRQNTLQGETINEIAQILRQKV